MNFVHQLTLGSVHVGQTDLGRLALLMSATGQHAPPARPEVLTLSLKAESEMLAPGPAATAVEATAAILRVVCRGHA